MRRRDRISKLRKRRDRPSGRGTKSSAYSFILTMIVISVALIGYKFPYLMPDFRSIITLPSFEKGQNTTSSISSYYSNKSVTETGALFKNTGNENITMVFATWCSICRSDMPQFIAASNRSPSQFIAISIDTNEQRLEQYIKSMPPNNIKWIKVPYPCPGFPCTQLENEFNNIGIDYYGGVPKYTILASSGVVTDSDITLRQINCFTGGACTPLRRGGVVQGIDKPT